MFSVSVHFILFFVYVTSTNAWPNSEFSADSATTEDARNRPSICFLPPIEDLAQCKGFFIRWTYNAKTDKCEEFIYGGCWVQRICSGINTLVLPSVIEKKKDEGRRTCTASIASYFFEATSGWCMPFRFSGCDGNGNRFPTEQECEQACFYGPQNAGVESCDPALSTV